MTQEDKFEEAKRLYETANADQKYVLESLFPELCESEDEMIRKELISLVTWSTSFSASGVTKEDADNLIAWLEKQGEIIKEWSEMKFNNIQTELQEMVNLKQKTEQGEQKSAWSEEDEKQARQIERIVHNEGYSKKLQEQIADWFKSLKDRMQPRQEWSKEDEMFVHGLIRGLAAKRDIHGHTTFSSDCIDITETINWLKSLRPQNKRKPTEEQIEALDDFIYAKYPNIEKYGAAVKSLYQDLKKLREE